MHKDLYIDVIAKSHQIDLNTKPMIFGFRGISYDSKKRKYTLNDNAPDIFNDILIFYYKNEFIRLVGTVDPGKKYTDNPLNKEGCFHLSDGVYFFSMANKGNYKFLHQSMPVNGWRDRNGNYQFDEGEILVSGQFDICIHGGSGFQHIGGWSAGCIDTQASPDSKEYINFMDTIEKAMIDAKIESIAFFLGEGAHFIQRS